MSRAALRSVPLAVPVPPGAAVIAAVRRAGAPFRDELVRATGLSPATVNRQVVALAGAGLLRERPDLVRAGAVGRPRVPVEIDRERFGVLGLHIGRAATTLAVGDLRGIVLGAVDVPTPAALPGLLTRLRTFGRRWPERAFLQVGVVVGDVRRWDAAALPDVVVVPQVEAVAGADALLSPEPPTGSTLHVYAREVVGAVLTVDGAVHAPSAGPGTISHLPVGGAARCPCGRTGCLEAAVGDAAVAAAAHAAGIVDAASIDRVVAAADGGSRAAHDLLVERAHRLGYAVALVRDLLNPDRVVLAGQAFTAYRPGLAHVSEAFTRSTALPPITLRVNAFGAALQAVVACGAALRPVYADPLGVHRRHTARSSPATVRAVAAR